MLFNSIIYYRMDQKYYKYNSECSGSYVGGSVEEKNKRWRTINLSAELPGIRRYMGAISIFEPKSEKKIQNTNAFC